MDSAQNRAAFYSGLAGQYAENEDGFNCNGEKDRRKHLKRLREAVKNNVLAKLRNCRDETLALELKWFRNCRFEQKYEDDDVYICPKYNPACSFKRPNAHINNDPLDPADASQKYYNEFAEHVGADGTTLAPQVIVADLISVLNGNESFTEKPKKDGSEDKKRIINFFMHHCRVRDKIRDHSKIKRCDAAIAELREVDFSFLLPECVLGYFPLNKVYKDATVAETELKKVSPYGTMTSTTVADYDTVIDKIAAYIETHLKSVYDLKKVAIDTAATNAKTATASKATANDLIAEVDIYVKAVAQLVVGFTPVRGTCADEAFIDKDQICYTGLMESEPFCASLVGSESVAKAARHLLAGCHKNCPGAMGHLPEAYPLLTCAPGQKGSKTYWTNVVVQKPVYLDGQTTADGATVVHKCEWVPAHDLMVAKLATVDDLQRKRSAYVKKEFLCLKQKEGIASKPPCRDLETVNTGMQINQLREITSRLKSKGLSKEACMSLMAHNLDYDGYGLPKTKSRKKRRSRSRSRSRSKKSRRGSRK